jgi:hypothetical protein
MLQRRVLTSCYVTDPLFFFLSDRSKESQRLKFRTSVRMAPSTDIDVRSNSVCRVRIPQQNTICWHLRYIAN